VISRKYKEQIDARSKWIIDCEQYGAADKNILIAAVDAMADEFPDVRFDQITEGDVEPGVLEFFCDCVRHHWARNCSGGSETACSITSRAIRCPYSDGRIIGLIQQFERRHMLMIWNPKAKARAA
jgi:hypothetical protein